MPGITSITINNKKINVGGFPDFTHTIDLEVNQVYVAPANGFIHLAGQTYTSGERNECQHVLRILDQNDNEIYTFTDRDFAESGWTSYCYMMIPVKEGTRYKIEKFDNKPTVDARYPPYKKFIYAI